MTDTNIEAPNSFNAVLKTPKADFSKPSSARDPEKLNALVDKTWPKFFGYMLERNEFAWLRDALKRSVALGDKSVAQNILGKLKQLDEDIANGVKRSGHALAIGIPPADYDRFKDLVSTIAGTAAATVDPVVAAPQPIPANTTTVAVAQPVVIAQPAPTTVSSPGINMVPSAVAVAQGLENIPPFWSGETYYAKAPDGKVYQYSAKALGELGLPKNDPNAPGRWRVVTGPGANDYFDSYVGQYPVTGANGTLVRGQKNIPTSDLFQGKNNLNQALDEYARKEMGLPPDADPYFFISYRHDEATGDEGESLFPSSNGQGKRGTVAEIAGPGGAAQAGFTHEGEYTGEGVTQNSPESYHQMQFENHNGQRPYVPVAVAVGIKGVDPVIVNEQLKRTSITTNPGVMFSSIAYKDDLVMLTNLNVALMFYGDWQIFRAKQLGIALPPALAARNVDYLDTPLFKQFCAEHMNTQRWIFGSLPLNEKRFVQLYGQTLGNDAAKQLFAVHEDVLNQDAKLRGKKLMPGQVPDFQTVWEKMGFTPEQVRPFKDYAEFEAYKDSLQQYGAEKLKDSPYARNGGLIPLPDGVGSPLGFLTSADIVAVTARLFQPFLKTGGFRPAAFIMGFAGRASERMGIERQQYIEAAAPILVKLLLADAKTADSKPEWFERAPIYLFSALSQLDPAQGKAILGFKETPAATGETAAAAQARNMGKLKELIVAQLSTPNGAPPDEAVEQIMGARALTLSLMTQVTAARPGIENDPKVTREVAYQWFQKAIAGDLQAARNVPAKDWHVNPERNMPPSLIVLVASGIVDASRYNGGNFTFKILGTLVPAESVVDVKTGKSPDVKAVPARH